MNKFAVLILAGLAAACANSEQYGSKVNDTSSLVQQGAEEGRKMWHHAQDAWDDLVNGKTDANSAGTVPDNSKSNTQYSGRKPAKNKSQAASSDSSNSSSSSPNSSSPNGSQSSATPASSDSSSN
jgi:hypothetical protein